MNVLTRNDTYDGCSGRAAYRLEVHVAKPGSVALSHEPSNGLLLDKMSARFDKMSAIDPLRVVQATQLNLAVA